MMSPSGREKRLRTSLVGGKGEPSPRNIASRSGTLKPCVAARMAGWGRKLPKGHGLGVAVHTSFGSHVAQVVEVSVKGQELKVEQGVYIGSQ